MREPYDYIQHSQSRIKEATEAIDVLAKHSSVEICYPTPPNNRDGSIYEKDVTIFVYAYLREWYKNNPHVTIKIANIRE